MTELMLLNEILRNFFGKSSARISSDIKLIGSGAYHDNYVYYNGEEKYLIRINKSSQLGFTNKKQILYEFATLKDVCTSGLTPEPVKIIRFKVGNRYKYILVEKYIEGNKFSYVSDLEKAAISLAKVHRCIPLNNKYIVCTEPSILLYKDAQARIDRIRKKTLNSEALLYLESIGKKITPIRISCSNKVGINNTDLNAGNLIISGEKCFIIDWEAARLSSIEWDIAHFIAKTTTLWDEEVKYELSEKERYKFVCTYAEYIGMKNCDFLYSCVKSLLKYIYYRCFTWALEYWLSRDSCSNYNKIVDTYIQIPFMEKCFSESL